MHHIVVPRAAQKTAKQRPARGRAMRELARRPRAREQSSSFHARHHEPVPVERVGNLRPREGQGNGDRGRVGDASQGVGQFGICGVQHGRAGVRGRGDHDRVREDGRASVHDEAPLRRGAFVAPGDRAHPRPQVNVHPIQSRLQRFHHLGQARAQGDEGRVARRAPATVALPTLALHEEQATQQAPVPLFHLQQLGVGGSQAEMTRVARVDAREQGLHNALEDFLAQVGGDELGHRHVATIAVSRPDEVEARAQFTRPGDQARAEEGAEFARDHQGQALGQGVQRAAGVDVGPPVLARGTHDVRFQPQFLPQPHPRGLEGEDTVGAAFDDEAVLAHGVNDSPQTVGRFQQVDVHVQPARPRLLLEVIRGCHAADAAADDGDAQGATSVAKRCLRHDPMLSVGYKFQVKCQRLKVQGPSGWSIFGGRRPPSLTFNF